MSDKKITDLQLRANVTDALNFPSDDGTQSYRVTAKQIKNYLNPLNSKFVTTTASLVATDEIVYVDSSAVLNYVVTLPTLSTYEGKALYIKKIGTDSTIFISLSAASGDDLYDEDGVLNTFSGIQYVGEAYVLIPDRVNGAWVLFGKQSIGAQSVSPTITGFGSTAPDIKYKEINGVMDLTFSMTAATVANSAAVLDMPSGYALDQDYYPFSNVAVASVARSDVTGSNKTGKVLVDIFNPTKLYFSSATTNASQNAKANGNAVCNTSEYISFTARLFVKRV